jgi:hypothetical protein
LWGICADVDADFKNQEPGRLAGLFAVCDVRELFTGRCNAALSNPTELINLGWIAEPGVGPPQVALGQYLRACGEPASDPYSSYRSG